MTRKNVLITLAIVLVGAAVVAANLYYRRDKGLTVTTDAIKARDLEAIVSASGKIQPKRLVNISADTPGRVVDLAVNEGDRVKKGQFLLQIDPQVAPHARRQRHGVAAGRRGVARSDAAGGRNRARAARAGAADADAPAGSLEAAAHDARGARQGDERREGRRVGASGTREAGQRAGQPHQAGARRPRERPLRSEQGPHRIADRRHRHAPQHSGGRDRRRSAR